MSPQIIPESNYLMRMADGTIKQVNPFTGTEVWTVPGRGNRPLGSIRSTPARRSGPARRLLLVLRPALSGDPAREGATGQTGEIHNPAPSPRRTTVRYRGRIPSHS
jgi:hypothetical protein